MLLMCYLRQGTVYIPHYVQVGKGGPHRMIGPVDIIFISDKQDIDRSLKERMDRPTAVVTMAQADADRIPYLHVYAGLKSLRDFDRDAQVWKISDARGPYSICGYKRRPKGGFSQDKEPLIVLPRGTAASEVRRRMIEILEAANGGDEATFL
jgi:hypothetical protein